MESEAEHGATDVGRRISERRRERGLSRSEVAATAGMDPGYLEYLETSPEARPPSNALVRLAAALETTTAAITGGGFELAPGQGESMDAPRLEVLNDLECREYLGSHGVGRFVFNADRGPIAEPVNYWIIDGDVVFRTGEGTSLTADDPAGPVSFEVDHLDDALHEGWSVLVSGTVHRVVAEPELGVVRSLDLHPWAGGVRDVYLRVVATTRTGRRIRRAG